MSSPGPACPTCDRALAEGERVCPIDGTVVESDATEPTLTRDILLGTKLGEYLVEQRIGSGGMGIVYRGRQPIISKTVAVKVLRPDMSANPIEVERILAEARTVNAIGHRGIIDIFGFGTVPDGRQYLVMEYLDGAPLDKVISDRAPMPYFEVLPILDELLDALGACHAAGIIHRDLKPSNIFLVTQRSGAAYVKILDFGLAKQSVMPGGEARQTRQSMVCGTPEFMAPEQARGMAVSPRTDLYALGCITYEMLTGHLPFVAPSAVELMMAHIEKPVRPPSEVCSAVPQALDDILLRLLAKEPDARPPNAGIVRSEIKRVRRQLAENETVFKVPRPSETAPRRKLLRPQEAAANSDRDAPTAAAPPLAPKPPPPARPTSQEQTHRVPAVKRTFAVRAGAAAVGVLLLAGVGAAVMAGGGGEDTAAAALPSPPPGDPSPGREEGEEHTVAAALPSPPPSAPSTGSEEDEAHTLAAAVPSPSRSDPAAGSQEDEEGPVAAATTTSPKREVARASSTEREEAPARRRRPRRARTREPGELRMRVKGWGEVYVDGKLKGKVPPTNVLSLPPGVHQLELRQKGKVVASRKITIRSGETVTETISVQ